MSCYEKIEPAIRVYEAAIREKHGDEFVKKSLLQFSEFQKKYYSKLENPDYSGNIKKFCYLYKYSVAHGYFLYRALLKIDRKVKPRLFERNITKVACIGGGPGSEIIGISRFLNEKGGFHLKNKVEITIFDREPSWENSCKLIYNCVSKDINVVFKFKQFDATDHKTYSKIDFSHFSHVFCCFFSSEIRKASIENKAKPFWKYLFDSLGPSRVFIAIDFRDNAGQGIRYLNSVIPSKRTILIEDDFFDESCPDSKACIIDLEHELNHRPKKKGQNFLKSFITT